MKKSLWDGDLAEYERGKSQLMRNKFKKINKLKPALKTDYKMKGLFATLGKALQRAEKKKEGESRSISRVLSRTVIPLRRPSLAASSNLPGSSAGHANGSLFGLAPSGVYLATDCCQPCGALLPHLFTLTGACALRRLFSVALSVGSRLPGVTWHSALWSPDFPPFHIGEQYGTATVRSTLRRQE